MTRTTVSQNKQLDAEKCSHDFCGTVSRARLILCSIWPGSKKLAETVHFALVFALLPALIMIAGRPAHAQTETILYDFPSTVDCCAGPASALTPDGNGNFYGTTRGAGQYSNGSVFEVTPNGPEYEITLYSFCPDSPSCPDGWDPLYSSVIRDKAGNLYGTTAFGGANGCGTVYELSPSGSSWTHTILFSFPPAPSGSENGNNCTPLYGVVMDKAGNLYGTTSYGAVSDTGGPTGHGGAVFELSLSGSTWTEKLLYTYPYYSDSGVAMDAAGNLFAIGANASDYPYLFELSANGRGGWTPSLVYVFNDSAQGWSPTATPVLDSEGNLYGTTDSGGKYHAGVVYEIVKGQGNWTYQDLFDLNGRKGGDNPYGGVALSSNGTIYGTTEYGGTDGNGNVFALVPSAGAYKEEGNFSFNGVDGNAPLAGVTLYDGNIYGTTSQGGSNSQGVVFEIIP